jgi:diguanylate cyclase (GGDEF)-like protein
VDTDVRKALTILLKRRLVGYRGRLDAHQRETVDPHGVLATRAGVFGKFGEAFQAYINQALRDYVDGVTLFGGFDPPHEAWDAFAEHAREAAEEMLKRFPQSSPAERKRVANLVPKALSEARTTFDVAAEQFLDAQRMGSAGELCGDQLDDRLPLGRRAAFDRDIALSVQTARQYGKPCALIMMDIDHFKRVNDNHGHPVGDEVLLEVARRLVARVGHRGKAYRYGGEEFVVLLPGYSAEEAFGLAERVRKDIEVEAVSSKKIAVTASFGTVSVPAEASSAQQLLKRADEALYEAKEGGRNQVRIGGQAK